MNEHIRIEGQLAAELPLAREFGKLDDSALLFRGDSSWTLLTITRSERWEPDGLAPTEASATVNAVSVPDARALKAHVIGRYQEWAWECLLDVAHDTDPQLHRLWIPMRLERDLDEHGSVYEGIDAGEDPVATIVGRLAERGWHVALQRPELAAPALPERVVGAVYGERLGWQAALLVRADEGGEIYTRLAQPGEVVGEPLQQLTGPELERLRDDHRRGLGGRDQGGWTR